jgi:hypothetical protein
MVRSSALFAHSRPLSCATLTRSMIPDDEDELIAILGIYSSSILNDTAQTFFPLQIKLHGAGQWNMEHHKLTSYLLHMCAQGYYLSLLICTHLAMHGHCIF